MTSRRDFLKTTRRLASCSPAVFPTLASAAMTARAAFVVAEAARPARARRHGLHRTAPRTLRGVARPSRHDLHARTARRRASGGGDATAGRSQRSARLAQGQTLGRRHRRFGEQSRLGRAVDGAAEGFRARTCSRRRRASTTRISRAGSTRACRCTRISKIRRTARRRSASRRRSAEAQTMKVFGDSRHRRSADVHRRPGRHVRSLSILAGASRARRRGARAGPCGRSDADHRRARSRRVHGARVAESDHRGIFNVAGPKQPLLRASVL